jgi:LacI family transcriptional regulator
LAPITLAALCARAGLAGRRGQPRAEHLQIGRDLVLIGFDDSPMNAWVAPWLHAVRVPYAAYGEAIVGALADTTARAIILPHELVIRA